MLSATWVLCLEVELHKTVRTTPCGNPNPTLNQNAMLVGNEKSTPSSQLKGMPERESSVTSDASGDTDILDHAEDGNQESRLIDECNETNTLTNQEERQRNYTEPVVGQATNSVYDSLSQGTDKLFANDKLHDEHTFSTSTQFDNDPASYSSSSLAQMRTTESNINNDGLWSQEIANSGLHGNNTSSTEVSNQSTAGPEDSTLSSLCQPVQDTTLSLFNISLLTPFAENVDVNVHIEENQYILVDGQRRWKCLMCPKIYSSKHNLVTHIFGHNGIKPHCCPVCGKLFKQTSHLQTHALTHSNVKPYSCQVCGRAFTQSSHVKRHMAVHMARRPHVCDLCDRGFVYPSELKAHREKHKNGDKDNACEKCGDTFESMQRLKQHKATVHKDVSDMTCSVCGKMFTYPSQLRDHMLKHGGKRPYICTECGMDFMKEHHLRAHQFTHTGLKPFTCITCCRSFNQKANLQRHQLIHQNLRRYRCNICGRDFSQPQVLKAHLVTHSSKKPHKCKICGKQFSRLHNLNGHIHMHKGTKPHVCFCGASFTLKGNLNRHCKEKHGQNVGASGATSLCREENQSTAEMDDGGFLLAAPVHLAVTRTSNEDSLESATYSTSVPKKKHRKSMPRKKIISQNGDVEDEEIEAAWRDENAADELHADPSRLPTYPTVVIPTKIQPTDVEKDDMNVELIDAIKQKKNVGDNHVMKPCNQIRNNIKNVSAGLLPVVVGRRFCLTKVWCLLLPVVVFQLQSI
ncbi:hypothetical protein LSAT2_007149 [Lamellibrachia satsuma]|nr:hypothetical protein LSAT2_007149 [Lamellibrachia satsuma]